MFSFFYYIKKNYEHLPHALSYNNRLNSLSFVHPLIKVCKLLLVQSIRTICVIFEELKIS